MAAPQESRTPNKREISSGPVTAVVRESAAYWGGLLPGASSLVRAINDQAREFPLAVPLADCNRRLAGQIATAADYAVGLSVADSLIGVFLRCNHGDGDRFALVRFLFLLVGRLRGGSAPTARDALFASLLILSQLDATFRSIFAKFEFDYGGLRSLDPERDSLRKLRKWLLARVPLAAVREADALSRSTLATLRIRGPAVYNPGFAAFGPISESDGDLIAGATLTEIKSLGQRGFVSNDIRQLIAYCLLNSFSGGPHEIRAVALCNPRRRFIWRSDLEDFSRSIAGVAYSRLVARARRDFLPHVKKRRLHLEQLRWLRTHGW